MRHKWLGINEGPECQVFLEGVDDRFRLRGCDRPCDSAVGFVITRDAIGISNVEIAVVALRRLRLLKLHFFGLVATPQLKSLS